MNDKDTIYRQDAIDALLTGKEFLMRLLDDADVVCQDREKFSWGLGLIESCINDIEELPSAEPRKRGKWIYGEKSGQDGWYCSECGGFIPWYYDFYGLDNIDFIEDFKTCPFCDSKMVSYTGADMEEGEEE